MQSSNVDMFIEGIKLAIAGMGMVGFFLTFFGLYYNDFFKATF